MSKTYPYKFKIVKENSDPMLAEIEQSGQTAIFTLKDAKVSIDHMKSMKKECEAQINLEKAKMQNVKDNGHTQLSTNDLEKMTDEDMQAAYIYVNSFIRIKTTEEKMAKVEEGLKLQAVDTEEIFKQTGLKYPEQPDDGKQIH